MISKFYIAKHLGGFMLTETHEYCEIMTNASGEEAERALLDGHYTQEGRNKLNPVYVRGNMAVSVADDFSTEKYDEAFRGDWNRVSNPKVRITIGDIDTYALINLSRPENGLFSKNTLSSAVGIAKRLMGLGGNRVHLYKVTEQREGLQTLSSKFETVNP